MSQFESAPIFGAFLALFGSGLLALFAVGALGSASRLPLAFGVHALLLVGAGALFVLAGTATALRDRVGPHRLLGAGYVVWGASFGVSLLGETGVWADWTAEFSDVFGYGSLAAWVLSAALLVLGVGYATHPSRLGLTIDSDTGA